MSEETVSPQSDNSSKDAGAKAEDASPEAVNSQVASPEVPSPEAVNSQVASPEVPSPEAVNSDVASSEAVNSEADALQISAAIAQDGPPAAQVAAAARVEGDISMRRSPWKSSMAAISYVQEAAKTDYVQIRTSDRLTIIALLFFCIAEVLSLVYSPLAGFRFTLMCCCDLILGTCIILFLIYRVGILSALNTRQALICWQLMMGCIFLGIFLCLNAIFGIAYLVETFFPHPML